MQEGYCDTISYVYTFIPLSSNIPKCLFLITSPGIQLQSLVIPHAHSIPFIYITDITFVLGMKWQEAILILGDLDG